MKKREALKTQVTEEAFAAALVIVVLLILPQLGATAMLVGSTIGLATYIFLFPKRFRSRSGSLTAAICLVLALAVAAAFALAVSLITGRWN